MSNILYGKRILHFNAPIRFDKKGMFLHESCSNYKVMNKTVNFLPDCHHYIVVPENNNIRDDRKNVTYLKYPYLRDALSNRSMFDHKAFVKAFNVRNIDFDFVFTHQPEVLLNILNALSEIRYFNEYSIVFSFFHWVICPSSLASSAIPSSFLRQLEAINLSTKIFLHGKSAFDNIEENNKAFKSIDLKMEKIREKTTFMPLSGGFKGDIEDIPTLKSKDKIVVFNHRWASSTGKKRMLSYFDGMEDKGYKAWLTAPSEESVPDTYIQKNLPGKKYFELLKNSHCSVCFVDGYATWNLSIQDGVSVNKPVLVYKNPNIVDILGEDYPFYFETKKEFQKLLENIPETFEWKLKDFDKEFSNNLVDSMKEAVHTTKTVPMHSLEWIYCILNGFKRKQNIVDQVQPNIRLNSGWVHIRKWMLHQGVQDNPLSSHTEYTIPDELRSKFDKMCEDAGVEFKLDKKLITPDLNGFDDLF